MQAHVSIGGGVLLIHAILLQWILSTPAPQLATLQESEMLSRFEVATAAETTPNERLHDARPVPRQSVPQSSSTSRDHARSEMPQSQVDSGSQSPVMEGARPIESANAGSVSAADLLAPSAAVATTSNQRVDRADSESPRTISIAEVQYQRPPAPVYPRRSQRLGESGEVWLKVLISAEGRATQVVVVRSSGFGALDQAAIDAMKATIFKPYTENGVAQPVWVQTPIAFHLESAS